MLGAGWPDARERFDRPSSALGVVAMAYGLGRLSTSASGLAILRRWRIGQANRGLLAVLAGAQVAVALTGSFPALVGAFTVIGLASGSLDSLGTRYQTVVRRVRDAGLIFGAYGVGATVGPAVVALTTWTAAYLAAAVVAAGAALVAGSPRVAWPAGIESPTTAAARPDRAQRRDRARVPTGPLVVSLLCFALYIALEVSTGNWASTYFEEHRGTSSRWAGLAVSGFWAGLTLSRLALSRFTVPPHRILAVGAPLVAASYLAVPLLPTPAALVAVVVAGGTLAVMVPTLVITTTERVGAAATGRVAGYQLLAANVGGTGSSALIGVLVARQGEGAPIWALVALAVVAVPVVLRSLHLQPPTPPTPTSTPTEPEPTTSPPSPDPLPEPVTRPTRDSDRDRG